MEQETQHKVSTLIGFSAIVMWGTMPALATFLGEVPPFLINTIALGVAFFITLLKWVADSRKNQAGKNFVAIAKDNFRLSLKIWALGIFGIFGFHLFYFLAYRHSPPLVTVIIINLWPLLTVIFSAVILGYALKANHMIGALLGLTGVGFISLRNGIDGIGMEPLHLRGYIEAVICALTWSLYSVFCRKWSSEMKPDSVGVFCGISALLSLLCHLGFEESISLSMRQWMLIVSMGLFPMGIAFFTWDYGMKHGNVRTLGLLSYCGPLIGISLLLLFGLAELSSEVIVAASLIIGGAFIGTFDFSKLRAKAA